eukprot:gene8377-5865_t
MSMQSGNTFVVVDFFFCLFAYRAKEESILSSSFHSRLGAWRGKGQGWALSEPWASDESVLNEQKNKHKNKP